EAAAAAKELHDKKRKKGGDGAKAEAPVNLKDTREGPQRRQSNEDITSDTLRETFGFKGINFGNWMKGDSPAKRAERQAHLNNAYDSMLDLAEILGVPPRAMSLNGMLGLAIGAQGHGGRAAAHFVPGVNEINLTREQGAGSLAHEWAHALDHYFATLAGGKLATGKTPFLTEHTTDKLDGVRPEVQEAFKAIVKAMRGRDVTPEELAAQERASLDMAKRSLERGLTAMRDNLANRTLKTGSGRSREDVLTSFDELANRLRNGDIGEGYLSFGKGAADMEPQVVAMLAMLYRESLGNKYQEIGAIGYNARRVAGANKARQSNAEHIPQVPSNFRREAVKLDRGTAGKYWSSTLEMFARSFQSYVLDRLAAQGARNDYLTRPQMDEATLQVAQEMGIGEDGDRYPRGDERNTINRGFDTLIASLRTRETDTGIALESVEEMDAADLTPAERAAFERSQVDRADLSAKVSQEKGQADAEASGLAQLVKRLLGRVGVPIHYLRGDAGLYAIANEGYIAQLKDEQRRRGQTKKGLTTHGLYLRPQDTKSGKAAVVVYTHTPGDNVLKVFTAAHEIAGHHGLRSMLGKDLEAVLDLARQNPTVRKVADSMFRGRDMAGKIAEGKMTPRQAELLATEEALADLAAANATGNWTRIEEKHGVKAPLEMRNKFAAMLANVVRKLKSLFKARSVGFSDAQVRQLLENARKAAAGGASVLNADGALEQVSVEDAKRIQIKTQMPTDPVFAEAVANTAGAAITSDGLEIDLVRYQKPEQTGDVSVRTGVFYLPTGSKQERYYRNGARYGGKVKVQGRTLIKRPLFAKGGTGGKAPEAAYDAIRGKGAYQKMRDAILKGISIHYGQNRMYAVPQVREVLEQFGADPSLAYEILRYSAQGNTLAYALQENIVAHAVREAGYDAVVGWSKGKAGPFVSEVFDVREATNPTEDGESDLHPAFESAIGQPQSALESTEGGLESTEDQTQDASNPSILESVEAVGDGGGMRGIFGKAVEAVDLASKKPAQAIPEDFDDAQRAAAMKFATFKPKESIRERWLAIKAGAADRIAQKVIDQFRPLKTLNMRAFMQAHMSKGTDGALEAVFNYGIPTLDGGAFNIGERTGGFKKVLTDLKGEHDKFLMWYSGNRAEKLAAEGREHLFTPEDIAAMKRMNAGVMPDGRNRKQVYAHAAKELARYNKAMLDIGEAAGVIDPEGRKLWESEFYIPFYRVME
ncbi:MAG: LPD1 domain-containing protein, partial [Minisyncoccia bacterium]